eukprot:401329-Karenia_brevis.AAC.1
MIPVKNFTKSLSQKRVLIQHLAKHEKSAIEDGDIWVQILAISIHAEQSRATVYLVVGPDDFCYD